MKNFIWLFSFFLSFSVLASSAQEQELSKFLQDKDLMPASGNFAGEYVENDEKRTLIILDDKQKRLFGIDASDMAFSNFRHNGEFYIATIPAMNVKGA